MPSIILSRGELLDLTGKAQIEAQKAELRAMGIDFYERSDGSLVVLRSILEGNEDPHQETKPELNLNAV